MSILFIIPEAFPFAGGIATFYHTVYKELILRNIEFKILVAQPQPSTHGCSMKHYEYIKENYISKAQTFLSHLRIFKNTFKSCTHAYAAYFQAQDQLHKYSIIEVCDYPLLYLPWLVYCTEKPILIRMHSSISQIVEHDPRNTLDEKISCLLEANCFLQKPFIESNSKLNGEYWKMKYQLNNKFVYPPFYNEYSKSIKTELKDFAVIVGRVQKWKGAEILAKAIYERKINFIFYWIGQDNGYFDVSMEVYLSKKYPGVVNKKLFFKGALSRTETLQIQSQARMVIVPSKWDTFNYSCVESMGLGKVVICSDGAGASELILDKKAGFIFKSGDSNDLAMAINEVISLNNEKILEIGANAKLIIQDKLNPTKIVNQMLFSYENLISNYSPIIIDTWLKSFMNQTHNASILNTFPAKALLNEISSRIFQKLKAWFK